jgi:hypothetical protein
MKISTPTNPAPTQKAAVPAAYLACLGIEQKGGPARERELYLPARPQAQHPPAAGGNQPESMIGRAGLAAKEAKNLD